MGNLTGAHGFIQAGAHIQPIKVPTLSPCPVDAHIAQINPMWGPHGHVGWDVVLMLLDLTAAFDTVDHNILISRMEHCVGIKGTVLEWFRSYLSGRSFSVRLGDFMSSSACFSCGVPQGSILWPILSSLYILPLRTIFRKYNVLFHCCADDTQLYLPLKQKHSNSIAPLLCCLEEIKA